MSGIRASLVFLLLMVSVISLFVLNRWQPEIRPGVPVQNTGNGIREWDQRAEIDPVGVNNPEPTVPDPSSTQRNGSETPGSTQDNGSRVEVPESADPFEVLLRVMDSRGKSVQVSASCSRSIEPENSLSHTKDSGQRLRRSVFRRRAARKSASPPSWW